MASDSMNSSPPTWNAMQYYPDGGVVGATQVPTPQPNASVTSPPIDEQQSEQMQPGDIPDSEFIPDAPNADQLQPGDIPDSEFVPDSKQGEADHYTSFGQQALAAAEGVGQGLIGPFAPAAELATGLTTPEDIRAREEYNPDLHTVSKLGSFVTSALSGTFEAGLLAKLSGAAVEAIPKLTAATYSAKIGAGALQGAIELGLLSAGDEATRAIVQDPTTSAATALTDIGLNTALGALGGGAIGGAARFLFGGGGSQVAQEVENFKGQMAYRMNVPDPTVTMHEELSSRYNELKDMYDETYGVNGTKAQAIAKSVPKEVNDQMVDQANAISDKLVDTVAKMRKKPYSYPDRLVNKLEADVNEFRSKVAPTDGTQAQPIDIFNSLQDLKQMAQGYAKYSESIKPIDESYDFVHALRPLGNDLKTALEDPKVWGDAGMLQQKINQNFVKFKPFMEGYEKYFTDKIPDLQTGLINNETSLNKIQTMVNQAGTFKDVVKKNILKGFLDNGEKFASALDDAYSSVGSESPFTPSPMNVSRRSLEDLTPGMKVANAFVDKGLGKGAAQAVGGGIGAGVGSVFGPYGTLGGAYLGKEALGPMLEKMLPVMGKAFFQKVADVRGLRVGGQYIAAALNGQKLMSQGAKNVFKASAEVLPAATIPSVTALHKLNTRLVAAQDQPEQFTQNMTNNPLGNMMPDHAQALAQTISNAVGYVNSQRPNTAPQAPLDSNRTPSAVKQGAFNNLLTIAQQPLTVMAKVKSGTITPDDIKHLNALYPAAWQNMQKELTNAMVNHTAKGGVVPYKTRIGMSLFMGQPMDSTFTPQAIQSAQPVGGQPQATAAGAPKQGSKSSTKSLHMISDQALTPLQAQQKRAGSSDE